MFRRAMAVSEAPGKSRPAAAKVWGTSTHSPSPNRVNPSIPTHAPGAAATTPNPSAATTAPSRTTATAPNRRTPTSPTALPTSVITM